MRNNEQIPEQNSFRSIDLDLQLVNKIIERGKNPEFKPPKTMSKLLNVLITKNRNIEG